MHPISKPRKILKKLLKLVLFFGKIPKYGYFKEKITRAASAHPRPIKSKTPPQGRAFLCHPHAAISEQKDEIKDLHFFYDFYFEYEWIILPFSILPILFSPEICPVEPKVEEGSSVTISCRVPDGDSRRTAQDFSWYHNSQALPQNTYCAVNNSVSRLLLVNVTHDHSGLYFCCFARYGNCSSTRVDVGGKA